MTSVALAFAVLHISDDPGALAQVLAAHMAAMVIFLLLGGVVADRYSRTVIMQTSHALTFLTQGMAAYLVLTGTAQIWHLVALEAVNGAVSAFGMPAMMGVVPLVVGPDRIQQANALLSFSRSSITIVGPALAGALVVGAGPGWALLVDSALFLVAIPMLRQVALPGRDRNVTASPSVIAELREGWGEFTSRTWVWLIVVAFGVLNAVHMGAIAVLGPVIAKASPVGEQGWGLALSAEAAGTVVMTLALMRTRLRRPLVAGMLGVSLIALPMLVLAVAGLTTGADAPAGVWIACLALGWLGSAVFAAFGLTVGALFRSDGAMQVMGGGIALLAFAGNVFVPLQGTMLTISQFTPMFGVVSIARYPLDHGMTAYDEHISLTVAIVNVIVWAAVFTATATFYYTRSTRRQ